MKKLLSILTASFLITGITPMSLNNKVDTSNLTSLQTIIKIHLKKLSPWLTPTDVAFCLPCAVYMAYNHEV